MDVIKVDSRPAIEPQFLSQAQSSGVKLRIGQMNRTEHEGKIVDIGRYEINIEENGKVVTILKQEIAFLSTPQAILTVSDALPGSSGDITSPDDHGHARPNIQHEFLDKAIRESQMLTLFLINGQRIKALIEAYDNFTILLKENGKQHLYYKHSITTINR